MILYSKEFFKKKFKAASMKEAYLKACKWYATNVISKDELRNVKVEFEKGTSDDEQPTITIHLFATLSESELRERYCKICRESHTMFYMNSNFSCDRCEAKAYQRRADEMIHIKIDYLRGLIAGEEKEEVQ